MKEFPKSALTRDINAVTRAALKAPVLIKERGRPSFVVLAYEDWEKMTNRPKNPRRAIRTEDTPPELRDMLLKELDRMIEEYEKEHGGEDD